MQLIQYPLSSGLQLLLNGAASYHTQNTVAQILDVMALFPEIVFTAKAVLGTERIIYWSQVIRFWRQTGLIPNFRQSKKPQPFTVLTNFYSDGTQDIYDFFHNLTRRCHWLSISM